MRLACCEANSDLNHSEHPLMHSLIRRLTTRDNTTKRIARVGVKGEVGAPWLCRPSQTPQGRRSPTAAACRAAGASCSAEDAIGYHKYLAQRLSELYTCINVCGLRQIKVFGGVTCVRRVWLVRISTHVRHVEYKCCAASHEVRCERG